jgi:hypothetical protein
VIFHLAEAISARAPEPVPVFIEVNIANEPTKSGFMPAALPGACKAIRALPHLDLRGMMTVAPMARDPEDVRPVFQRLSKEAEMLDLLGLSMGMSDDFEVAVEEGATLARRRAIFGNGRDETRVHRRHDGEAVIAGAIGNDISGAGSTPSVTWQRDGINLSEVPGEGHRRRGGPRTADMANLRNPGFAVAACS